MTVNHTWLGGIRIYICIHNDPGNLEKYVNLMNVKGTAAKLKECPAIADWQALNVLLSEKGIDFTLVRE